MEEVKKQGMESLFVSYDIALALKQLGFDEPCLTYYFSDGVFNDATEEDDTLYPGDPRFYSDTNSSLAKYLEDELKYKAIAAPLYQQAFRWFRYKYNLEHHIWSGKINSVFYGYDILSINSQEFVINNSDIAGGDCDYDTYEEAELACLKKLIEIVESQKQ